MSFQFNSKGFFQIFLTSFLILIPFTLFLIFSKYENFIGGGYNFYYILAMLLLLLFTAFLNCYRKNPFLDLTNLFFLLTFILPAVLSHMGSYYSYQHVYDFTIAQAFPNIIYQYLIFSISILFINPCSNFNFSQFTISNKFIIFLLIFPTQKLTRISCCVKLFFFYYYYFFADQFLENNTVKINPTRAPNLFTPSGKGMCWERLENVL